MTTAIATMLLEFLWQGAALVAVAWAAERLLVKAKAEAALRFGVLLGCMIAAPVIAGLTLRNAWNTLPVAHATAVWSGVALPEVVTWTYGAGVLWMSARMLLEVRAIGRLRATGVLLHRLAPTVEALRSALGIRQRVVVVESAAVRSPILVGWLRPMILLPVGLMTHMDTWAIEAVLAHELAHVRRWDPWLKVMQRGIVTLFFFHPLMWWLSARLDVVREEACDDLAVDALKTPLRYARAITELEGLQAQLQPLALGIADATHPKGTLMKRIQRISTRTPRSPGTSLLPAAAGLLAAGLLCGVAVAAQQPSDTTESKDEAQQPPLAEGVSIAWLPDSVLEHEADISEAALRYDIDPNLLAIMVLVESNGKRTARSPRGARGLMQLMPETAAGIAAARGLADHTEARLEEPAYNLDMGAWFLAQQFDQFGKGRSTADGISWAAAAYNGGPTRVRKVLEGSAELSKETTQYRARVVSLWEQRGAEQLER